MTSNERAIQGLQRENKNLDEENTQAKQAMDKMLLKVKQLKEDSAQYEDKIKAVGVQMQELLVNMVAS
jgi:FtsZ-binding cell division protein ZapB